MKLKLQYLLSFFFIFNSVYGQDLSELRLKVNTAKGDTSKIIALNDFATLLTYSNPDSAITLCLQALDLSKKNKWKNGIALSHYNIGELYLFVENYDKSIENYKEALKWYTEVKNKSKMASMYISLGLAYYNKTNILSAEESKKANQLALNNCYQGLKIRESLKDSDKIAYAYIPLGSIYEDLEEYDKARECFNKALNIRLLRKDSNMVGYSYITLGETYLSEADDSTLSFDSKKKMYSSALELYKKASEIHNQIKNSDGILLSNLNIANILMKQKKYVEAKKILLEIVELSKKSNDIFSQHSASRKLSNLFYLIGDFKNSLEYYKEYQELNDSINSLQNNEKISKATANFENEKKNLQIKNLIVEKDAKEKVTIAENRKQNIIIISIISVLLLVAIFSIFLFNRYKLTQKQKKVIETQKHLVEEKHKEITDSINYAERIQRSFLATSTLLDINLKDYFVFFQPKDVVSGDFYWANKLRNGNFALTTADSTGHGVPGAIMSLLNVTSLEAAIKDGYSEPAEIFNSTRNTIIERLKLDGSIEGGKDGMDASLICFDFKNSKFTYATANNPIWIVRNNELIELKGDKMPVGKHDKDHVPFTQFDFQMNKGDVVYTLTDGFPDQFGGAKGKKFMYKQLKETLVSISQKPMSEQKDTLNSILKIWMGNVEQVDDITIIGIRV
jgi:serine phosphatase RsbU (regulator of sigma subunit)